VNNKRKKILGEKAVNNKHKKILGEKAVNNKHKKILKAIFEEPIRLDIRWNDIESLIEGLGGSIKQGKGSRVMFVLSNKDGRFHKPHPEQEIKKYVVKDLRDFLEIAGFLPEE